VLRGGEFLLNLSSLKTLGKHVVLEKSRFSDKIVIFVVCWFNKKLFKFKMLFLKKCFVKKCFVKKCFNRYSKDHFSNGEKIKK
jgi:hypothetical protein